MLALRVVSARRGSPFDTCCIVGVAQRLHLHTLRLPSFHTVDGKDIPFCESACRLVVGAAPPQVVTSYEARLDAIQEWLEVEETGGGYTQALDRLGTDGDWPSIQGRICRIWDPVPEDELAHTGCDDSASVSAWNSIIECSYSHETKCEV